MKWLLQRRFLPLDYEQFLYQQYQNCWQANRTVNEYTEEFHWLNAGVNFSETEDQLIAHYTGGLKLVIQDRLALQGVWTITDAVNLAMKVENQINRSTVHTQSNFRRPTQEASSAPRGSTTPGSNNNSNKDAPSTQNSAQNQSGTLTLVWSNTQGRNQPQQKLNNDPYVRPNLGKCFWCNQSDHLSNNCPNRRSINFVEEGGSKEE